MEKLKFKVLKYGHILVDVSMLKKGIYETKKPHLFSATDTKESIIQRGIETLQKVYGVEYVADEYASYFDNLKACDLVECELTIG